MLKHMQNGVYAKLGTLTAMALVHGGSGLNMFSTTIFRFVCGTSAANLIASIAEVPESHVRDTLQQVIVVITFMFLHVPFCH